MPIRKLLSSDYNTYELAPQYGCLHRYYRVITALRACNIGKLA